MTKGRWSRKPAKKADSKASAGTQMSDEELEAQARVYGVIRTSVAAHGGLGVPWNMDDLPAPEGAARLTPEEEAAEEDRVIAQTIAAQQAALGGAMPEYKVATPFAKD
jgi:hypothetical protein